MSLLDKLERVLGRFAIPGLTLYLIIGQVFVVLATMLHLIDSRLLLYAPTLVVHGQWWRLLTFMFVVPLPGADAIWGWFFLVFGWYLFFLMGSALESYWGAFRFNVYLFFSYALLVGLAFLTPNVVVTNVFILGSIFLAFAYLNPDFELTLFFILPIKVKWLAFVYTAGGAALFFLGGLAERIQIGASIAGFVLFFGGDMLRRLGFGGGGGARRSLKPERAPDAEARHVCLVCHKTDVSNPDMDFRYCSKCAGDQCYCPEHIHNHVHVLPAHESKKG